MLNRLLPEEFPYHFGTINSKFQWIEGKEAKFDFK